MKQKPNPGKKSVEKRRVIPFETILGKEEIKLIKDNSNIVHYLNNDIIFKQNTRTSHVMYILSGLTKLFRENRNHRIRIVKLGVAGEFLGLASVFGEDIYSYSAVAIEKSMIYIIDRNVFDHIILNNGKYAQAILKSISSEDLVIFNRLVSQSQKQLPGRVADIILYFSEKIYRSMDFSFPLTRTELAELAGTTKESLIRTLMEFRNDKIIRLEGKKVHINSIDIIRTLSRFG